jgi:cyclohexanone monooxygenase
VEPTSEAEEQWVTSLAASEPDAQVEFFRACTPGYYSNEGHLENIPRLGLSIILGRSTEFYGEIREWRKDGALRGLELE